MLKKVLQIFLTNNRFLDMNKENLYKKQFDIDFLGQYLHSLYIERNKMEKKGV